MSDKIPVIYVGKLKTWQDHIYGSDKTFLKNKPLEVDAWLAHSLLRHPEFKDGRENGLAGTPIVASKPVVRDEAEDQDLDEIQQNVRLDTMTRDQMSFFAMRSFGVFVDPAGLKADIRDAIHGLIRQRGAR